MDPMEALPGPKEPILGRNIQKVTNIQKSQKIAKSGPSDPADLGNQGNAGKLSGGSKSIGVGSLIEVEALESDKSQLGSL